MRDYSETPRGSPSWENACTTPGAGQLDWEATKDRRPGDLVMSLMSIWLVTFHGHILDNDFRINPLCKDLSTAIEAHTTHQLLVIEYHMVL